MRDMRLRFLAFLVAAAMLPSLVWCASREMRGAWLSTAWQEKFTRQTDEQNRKWLSEVLDSLESAGINAVFFQVRPQADAFYRSDIEPPSRWFTTGELNWDPLEYMVNECHERGMELHAWLNPYRATTSAKQTLPKGHFLSLIHI